MLEKLLHLIAAGGTHQLKQLARQLDVSETLLESMIEELVRLGYLQPLSVKCHTDCEACPIVSDCTLRDTSHVWTLTEAGRKLAQKSS